MEEGDNESKKISEENEQNEDIEATPTQRKAKKEAEQEDEVTKTSNNAIKKILEDKNLTFKNEKLERCYDFKMGKYGRIQTSFVENSPQEELVLEHVIQYQRSFDLVYGKRELMLYPKNECGLSKFICTTIRPTKIGLIELNESFEKCAKCLSLFMHYEELENPVQFPSIIPSPSNVLIWQKGDSFDISIVLVSLLIGAGFDAYCVYGTAPREITTHNEALMENPFEDEGKLEEDKVQEPEPVAQKVPEKKKEIVSSYLKNMEIKQREEKEMKERIAKKITDDAPDDLPKEDEKCEGKRMHCWVLIKKGGQREVEKSCFIEPTTARIYKLDESRYLTVEGVFNHQNYWINMKNTSPVKQINFENLYDETNWEYVMMPPGNIMNDPVSKKSDDLGNPLSKEAEKMGIKQGPELGRLEMPPPWPPKLYVDRESFAKLSPMGEYTAFYLYSRIDTYAEYSQPDGLIKRISLFEDYSRLRVKEIRYFFKHRSDKLRIKRRFPFEFKTIEEFDPGRYPYWKKVTTIDRRERDIEFYPTRFNDGLLFRKEIIGHKTIEKYQNRDDKVCYRSIRFVQKGSNIKEYYSIHDHHLGCPVTVVKMTQKFEKNEFIPAREQIDKMVIDLALEKVFIRYHMGDNDITPVIKDYDRNTILGSAKLSDTTGEKKLTDPVQVMENAKLYNLEKVCHSQLASQEDNAKQDEKAFDEKTYFFLEKSLHDKARDRFKETQLQKEEFGAEAKESDPIYLAIKAKKAEGRVLSKEEAQEIKSEIMKKLLERLMARADIIQKRLENEKAQLEALENNFRKKSEKISKDEEAKCQEEIDQHKFRIAILSDRAFKFEVMAYKRYQEMNDTIINDPRFAAISKKK